MATRSAGPGQPPRIVMSYSKGDYFGELALLRNEPRAASVSAKGRCKICAIDKHAFVRLLGPCLAIMQRKIDSYEGYAGDEDPFIDCLDETFHGETSGGQSGLNRDK